MWLPAWGVDLDMLVERFASQGPIAFVGAAKTWRGRWYRIERIAALKVETRAAPALVHERFAALKVETRAAPSLMRETLDCGDRTLQEASAAHTSSGELPADSSGLVAIAPRLEHFLADCYIVELDVTGQDFRYLQQEFVLAGIKSPITEARRVDARRVLPEHVCRCLEAFLRFYCVPTIGHARGAGAALTRATGAGRGVQQLPTPGPRRPDGPGLGTLGSVAA